MKNKWISRVLVLLVLQFVLGACKKDKVDPEKEIKSHTYSSSTWTYSSPYYKTNLSVKEITSSNINSVAVMVYFSTTDGNWIAIPFTQYTSSSNYFMGFNLQEGNVEVTWVYNNTLSQGDDPDTFYGTKVKLKVVVIPASARKANPDLDLTNYEEVRERLGIE